MSVVWQVFPRSARPNETALSIVRALDACFESIRSDNNNLDSDGVLQSIAELLRSDGFVVERSKVKTDKIPIPVLFGRNGKIEKSFEADAFHAAEGIVLEVEAGRGVDNNQFLKDLFQACMMQDARHLVICVRNLYRGSNDFEKVHVFMDTLFASNRLRLPLETVMIVGY